ncbi:MAG: hypothetical protein KatS3mg108_3440 [Isosphaeraceae bacterium]|nr:MAG: hypothetical protein KatS3mg108_3440 [Isosphaeraceae bacterium]
MPIRLNCPKCAAEVPTIWREANQIFECPSCKTEFVVSETGQYRVVRRGLWASSSDHPPTPARPMSSADYEKSEALWRYLVTHRWFFLTLGVLLLATVAVVWSLIHRGPALPSLLSERAEVATEAFLEADLRTLSALADPAARRSVAEWVVKQRPAAWNASPRPPVIRGTTRLYLSEQTKTAGFLAQYRYPVQNTLPASITPDPMGQSNGDGQPTPGSTVNYEVLLHWKLDPNGEWYLDLSRMLREQRSQTIVR